MKHWAAPLIGKPYELGASGPDSFDCVGLVRYYFEHRHGLALPDYRLHQDGPLDLQRFVRATRWRCASGAPQDEDVLTMDSFEGPHVGVVVRTCEGLGLLHAAGNNQAGSVMWQPLHSLCAYRNKQAWRQVCKS